MLKLVRAALVSALLLGTAGLLPAAVVDLTKTTSGVISTNQGDAFFTTQFVTGTDLSAEQPFLTLIGDDTERGYNTSNKNGVFDTAGGSAYNYELQLADLNTVRLNGVNYYSFLLVAGEPTNAPLIQLDALKIYSSTTKGATTTDLNKLGALRFDLDSKSDSYVFLRDTTAGALVGDLAFFIPTSAFSNVRTTDYIYMYQQFSTIHYDFNSPTYGAEMTYSVPVTPVPELSTALPLTLVFGSALGLAPFRRRRGMRRA